MTIYLQNRSPEPDETSVPAATEVFVEITTTSASGIDDAATSIYIEGILAYSAGVFQPGFAGPNSASTAPFADVRRINVDPSNPFDSQQVVTVRVVSNNGAGTEPLDESYDFMVQDTTAPRVLSAQARDQRTVRVTFNEAMLSADTAASADATNPANYSFSRMNPTNRAAVNVVAESVAEMPEVDYVVITAGTYDLLIETVCEDNEALLVFLAERLRAIEGVRETETFVYLRLVKQTYQYGTR